jgi:short subunit dehydrogenase-like uncharacterized protein
MRIHDDDDSYHFVHASSRIARARRFASLDETRKQESPSRSRSARSFDGPDVNDEESLRQAITGSHLVIHTAGPFQGLNYHVAEMCLDCGSHYRISLTPGIL